jgi:hypothetical protein
MLDWKSVESEIAVNFLFGDLDEEKGAFMDTVRPSVCLSVCDLV